MHRFDVRWVLGIGVLVWGLATALMGLAGGFVSIFILRLLLALGECVTFPSIQLIVSRNAGAEERGRVSSLIASGQGIGPMLGTWFGGMAMVAFGWRAMFVGLGAITMLWPLPWLRASQGRLRVEPEHATSVQVPYLEILRRRDFWGMALGMFAGNYGFYFLFIWLPSYVVREGGFSVGDMSSIVAFIYGVYALTTVATGRVADWWAAGGASSTRVWKSIVLVSAMGQLGSIAGCVLVEPRMAVWLLGLAGVFYGLATPALGTMTATLPGPRAGGRWAGAQAVAGQLAGVVSPIVTGLLIDRTGSYDWAFLVAGGSAMVYLFGYCVVVRRVEPLEWGEVGGTR